jgi:hypothetical protein
MRSLGPPSRTVFDGRVSDQDGADRQGTVEAARAEADDRAHVSDDDDAKAPAPADKFPEQFEAYIVRNGLPVVYSSELSIVFDRSGKFDGNWKALPLSWWRRRKVNSIARCQAPPPPDPA